MKKNRPYLTRQAFGQFQISYFISYLFSVIFFTSLLTFFKVYGLGYLTGLLISGFASSVLFLAGFWLRLKGRVGRPLKLGIGLVEVVSLAVSVILLVIAYSMSGRSITSSAAYSSSSQDNLHFFFLALAICFASILALSLRALNLSSFIMPGVKGILPLYGNILRAILTGLLIGVTAFFVLLQTKTNGQISYLYAVASEQAHYSIDSCPVHFQPTGSPNQNLILYVQSRLDSIHLLTYYCESFPISMNVESDFNKVNSFAQAAISEFLANRNNPNFNSSRWAPAVFEQLSSNFDSQLNSLACYSPTNTTDNVIFFQLPHSYYSFGSRIDASCNVGTISLAHSHEMFVLELIIEAQTSDGSFMITKADLSKSDSLYQLFINSYNGFIVSTPSPTPH